jgi:hypothetical protein
MTKDQCPNDETRPSASFRHLVIGEFEHSFEFRISSFGFHPVIHAPTRFLIFVDRHSPLAAARDRDQLADLAGGGTSVDDGARYGLVRR